MGHAIRLFLVLEAASFILASLVHFGVLALGYAHGSAAIAESVIGAVLLLALGLSWVLPASTRRVSIAAQGFGLLGTLVGALTIAIGVGPRTVPDVVYHAAILLVLVSGLVAAARSPAKAPSARTAP